MTLNPVYASTGENKIWAEATPSGRLEMTISNKAAFGKLKVGQSYLINFVEAS